MQLLAKGTWTAKENSLLIEATQSGVPPTLQRKALKCFLGFSVIQKTSGDRCHIYSHPQSFLNSSKAHGMPQNMTRLRLELKTSICGLVVIAVSGEVIAHSPNMMLL